MKSPNFNHYKVQMIHFEIVEIHQKESKIVKLEPTKNYLLQIIDKNKHKEDLKNVMYYIN